MCRDGAVSGGGVLVDEWHVVTCAHVVNAAVGLGDDSQDRPEGELEVDFPDADHPPLKATVAEAGWFPIGEDGSWDIAVLRLRQQAPPGCRRPPLNRSANAEGHRYSTRGFPDRAEGLATGAPAAGEILELSGPRSQWRLLSLERGPYKAQSGFSGCPIWDEEEEAVVGIYAITSYAVAERDRSAREAGYMITMETLLAAWPDLERELGWRASDDPQYERHWEPHSRGVRDSRQPGQMFTGREAVLERLVAWIEGGAEPVALVTGRRGSGKSAVLARLVTQADQPQGDPSPGASGARAPSGSISLALVADREQVYESIPEQGMTVQGAAGMIANWMGIDSRGPRDLVEKLPGQVIGGGPAPLIVVDQLDEAEDRHKLAQFLGRLAREGGARVLIGLRTDEGEGGISVAKGLGSKVARFDLDSRYRDDLAVLEYARALLRQIPASNRDEDALEHLAGQIAKRAGESFLRVQTLAGPHVAAGVIGELAERGSSLEELDEMEDALRNAANNEAGDFEANLRRLRHLLTPLAYAAPDGLPAGGEVWPAMAEALGGHDLADVRYLLDESAAAHLLRGDESGTRFALAHPTLRDGLRDGRNAEADNERIAAKLSALYPPESAGPTDPYVALNLARHVAQASPGAWEELAERAHVLDRLDPVALGVAARPLLLRGAELPPQILGALDSQHLGTSNELADRTGLRQLGMARTCGKTEFREEDGVQPVSSWWLKSAVLRQHTAHLTLPASSAVNGVATLAGSDGVPLLAAGCEDHSVRLWSVATGRPHGDPPGCERPVRAICACEAGSATWLVFGDESGLVQYWDPVTEEHGEFRADHGGQLRAVTAFAADGRLFVVTAGDGEEALIWQQGEIVAHLRSGAPVRALASRPSGDGIEIAAGNDDHCVLLWRLGTAVLVAARKPPRLAPDETLRGSDDWLRSVFLYGTDEGVCVAGAGDDGKPRVWEPPRATPVMVPQRGHHGRILATVAYEEASGAQRLATAGADRRIRLWDPAAASAPNLELEGHDGAVRSLATHRIDGAVSLISGGVDRTVRIWPLASTSSRPAQDTRLAMRPLTAVGRCKIGGALAVVAGYTNGAACVWNPTTGQRMTRRIRAHAGAVRAIAPVTIAGKPAFASGGDDGLVRFFDPVSGEEVATPLEHEESVRAIVVGVQIEGAPALATGSEDAKIRFWKTGEEPELIATWPQPGPVRGLAPVEGHPRGRGLAVVGYGRSVHLAMVDGKAERREDPVETHADRAMAVQVYADEFGRPQVVTTGDDGYVVAVDPLAEEPPREIGKHDGAVRALALIRQPDRLLVASGGDDGAIVLWDPDGSGPVARIELGLDVEALAALGERLLVGTAEGHIVIEIRPG